MVKQTVVKWTGIQSARPDQTGRWSGYNFLSWWSEGGGDNTISDGAMLGEELVRSERRGERRAGEGGGGLVRGEGGGGERRAGGGGGGWFVARRGRCEDFYRNTSEKA